MVQFSINYKKSDVKLKSAPDFGCGYKFLVVTDVDMRRLGLILKYLNLTSRHVVMFTDYKRWKLNRKIRECNCVFREPKRFENRTIGKPFCFAGYQFLNSILEISNPYIDNHIFFYFIETTKYPFDWWLVEDQYLIRFDPRECTKKRKFVYEQKQIHNGYESCENF